MEEKTYQISLLFPPSLNQESLDKAIAKAKKLITDQGGSFSKDIEPKAQLKKLSYPINKHNEAFYLTLNNVSLPGEIIEALKQQLNLDNDLIRYMIVNQPKVKEKTEPVIDYKKMVEKIEPLPQDKKPPISTETYPSGKPAPEKEAPKKSAKSQIEDLDKKLEEILSE